MMQDFQFMLMLHAKPVTIKDEIKNLFASAGNFTC